jgi:hypothetical protein
MSMTRFESAGHAPCGCSGTARSHAAEAHTSAPPRLSILSAEEWEDLQAGRAWSGAEAVEVGSGASAPRRPSPSTSSSRPPSPPRPAAGGSAGAGSRPISTGSRRPSTTTAGSQRPTPSPTSGTRPTPGGASSPSATSRSATGSPNTTGAPAQRDRRGVDGNVMSGFQRASDFANQAMNVASQARPLVDLLANQFAPRSQPQPQQPAAEPASPAPPAALPSSEPAAPEPTALAAPSPPPAADTPSEPAPTVQPMSPPPPAPSAAPSLAAAPVVAAPPSPMPPPLPPAQPAPSWPQLAAAMPQGVAPSGFTSPFAVGPAAPPGWVDPRLFAAAMMNANPYAQRAVAAALPGWPGPSTVPGPSSSPVSTPPMSSIADLMQALQTGAIPHVSGLAPMSAFGFGAPPNEPNVARPARDATALLSLMLSNAQVQDALRRAAVQRTPDNVQLALPASAGSARRDVVPLPMDAVVQAIAALAHRSRLELDESAAEEADGDEAPREFLLSESGDLLVDPADADRRVDLVVHYFRCAAQAERGGS